MNPDEIKARDEFETDIGEELGPEAPDKYFESDPEILVGNVLFWNVLKMLEKKDMRYVLKKFWNVAETCREIEDMTLYLLHI